MESEQAGEWTSERGQKATRDPGEKNLDGEQGLGETSTQGKKESYLFFVHNALWSICDEAKAPTQKQILSIGGPQDSFLVEKIHQREILGCPFTHSD